jgi:NADH-quinone oxidoreductase subunit J
VNVVFYLSAVVAVFATCMVITRLNAVHALLYLIVSFLAVAMIFYTLGAPFVAAMEIVIYAGAIMVLFVFVIMMLNLGPQVVAEERRRLRPGMWVGPGILSLVLLGEFVYVVARLAGMPEVVHGVSPKEVGLTLFGPYLLGVELASFLLLAGLVGAYHIGRRTPESQET